MLDAIDNALPEIAEILALGFLRLNQKIEHFPLDFSPDRSVYVEPRPDGAASIAEGEKDGK